jgi:hypothetical protein
MRRASAHRPDTEIDVRFAEMDRQKLRVAVREVQQRHVAERRRVVHRRCVLLGACGPRRKRHAGGGTRRQHP